MHQSPAFHVFFSDITNIKNQKHFCLRCLCLFLSEEVMARHNELCTRDDFMWVRHVLPVLGSKQAQIKINN